MSSKFNILHFAESTADVPSVLSRHISTYCTNPRLGLSSVLASTVKGVQLSTAHSMQHSGNSYYYYYLPCL